MINELAQLAEIMKLSGITTYKWHKEYNEIGQITKAKPYARIVLEGSTIALIERVTPEKAQYIRRYGSNQASYPAMSIYPLYRLSSKDVEKLDKWAKKSYVDVGLDEIKGLCTQSNWLDSRYLSTYKGKMVNKPEEIIAKLGNKNRFSPINQLFQATSKFADHVYFHKCLTEKAFELIRNKEDVDLAIKLLFAKKEKDSVSIIFDTFELEDIGYSTTSSNFSKGLNDCLNNAEAETDSNCVCTDLDAFGFGYSKQNEGPMPKAKVSNLGFVHLRSMNSAAPCQMRYGLGDTDTYPISYTVRSELKAVLEWISDPTRENITWVKLDAKDKEKVENLYVYPSQFSNPDLSFTSIFKKASQQVSDKNGSEDKRIVSFESEAKSFSDFITKIKQEDSEHYPDQIHLFALRKVDDGNCKVFYSNDVSTDYVIRQNREWIAASANIPSDKVPEFCKYGKFFAPFPLEVKRIINTVWKMSGELSEIQLPKVYNYHGLDLLLKRSHDMVRSDFKLMSQTYLNLGVFAGSYFIQVKNSSSVDPSIAKKIKESMVFTGMLLYWAGIKKEDYMIEYPFLLGRLLKISDCLHELYSHEVRNSMPKSLVGNSMYMSACVNPKACLSQLGQRMTPFINWASVNKNACIPYGRTAGRYLRLYEETASALSDVLTDQTRFSDTEKAQLFLGYLSSLPKSNYEKADSTNEDEMADQEAEFVEEN